MSDKKKFTPEDMSRELNLARDYVGQDPATGGDSGTPIGYVPIALSTEGYLYAPAFVHARSFKTSDMAHLSLIRTDRLPENNAKVIKDVVWEDTDPAQWHVKEVVEFLLKHYLTYFGKVLKDVPWPVNQDDRKYLRETSEEQLEALNRGDYVPRVDIDISTLQFKVLERPMKTFTISKKDSSGQTSKFQFRLPRFGDVITLRAYMQSEFGMKDAQFESVRKALEETGAEVTHEDRAAYQDYMSEKLQVAADANMAMLLQKVDGEPVKTLEAALKYVGEDPRFDYTLSQRVKQEAENAEKYFGVEENIKLKNPITNKKETRRFSFRLYDILKAILVSEPDTYDVSFDEEDL